MRWNSRTTFWPDRSPSLAVRPAFGAGWPLRRRGTIIQHWRTSLTALLAGFVLACGAGAAPRLVSGPELPSLRPALRPAPLDVRTPGPDTVRPLPRDNHLPRARWEHRTQGPLWTKVTLSAVQSHGKPLLEVVPEDIEEWCPAYPTQDAEGRAAFWAALISTLTRYESTWNPRAVGGGGLWHGLLQILPTTAELRRCRAVSGEGLRHGPSNLNCGVRIMAVTVPRDEAVAVKGERRWRGVAADWGPIRTDWMRRDMQRYTKRQVYCRPLGSVRPQPRPKTIRS
jgi:hypothetical protein